MSRHSLLAIALLALACAPPQPTAEVARAVTVNGLVAAWGFDEASGPALDATGNNHTGTLAGQARVAGKYGGALSFGGNLVTVADAADLRLTRGTIEAWVRPTSTLTSWATVLMKEAPGGMAYTLYAVGGAGKVDFDIVIGAERELVAGTKPAANVWTHLAVAYDGAHQTSYINGVQVGTRAQTGNIASSSSPLRIGANTTQAGGESFPGIIDEVRVWNVARTAAQVQTDMATPINVSGGAGGMGGGGTTGAGGTGGGVGAAGTTGAAGSAGAGGGAGASGAGGSDASAGAGGADAGGAGGGADAAAGAGGQDAAAGAAGSAGSAGGAGGGTGVYPLALAPGQRYLIDQQGRPFLIVGDAAWSLMAAITTADATTYLDSRQAHGFNSLLVNLVEHYYAPNAPRDAAGDLPFTGTLAGGARDFSTPNEAYFAHVDQVLQLAAARGLQLLLAPAYLGYSGGIEGWYSDMQANGVARLTAYGTYLGNRYKSFANILWVEGGDYFPPDPTLTRAVAAAIKAADPNHLHTVHAYPGESPLDEWAGESWLSVSTVYTYEDTIPIWQLAQAERARSPLIPFFHIESAYEYQDGPAALLRQQMFEPLLNGGFGFVFGNDTIWKFTAGWPQELGSVGAGSVGRLAAFWAGRSWDQLVPDVGHTFLTAGAGSGATFASAALTGDGHLGVVYLPAARALTVDMSRMSGTATARWFNPGTGAYTAIGAFANTGSQGFAPAGGTDWVLVLEAP